MTHDRERRTASAAGRSGTAGGITIARRRAGPGRWHGTTTDQRLLDRRSGSDWVHTDPWRVLRIQAEFVEGFGLLAELPRAVSVFGSARTPRGPGTTTPACSSARRWPRPATR